MKSEHTPKLEIDWDEYEKRAAELDPDGYPLRGLCLAVSLLIIVASIIIYNHF
jgi:preprotein translocase subunit Sec61beta